MEQKNKENFFQFDKLEQARGNKPEHWINKIISQDGSEAASYKNYIEAKASHMKEFEKRRSGQVSEKQTAEPAGHINPKEAQAMGQKVREKAEQEIAKAFNRQGFKCRIVKK